DEHGRVHVRHGERSLRLLEEILKDLRKSGTDKLTSRKIHDAKAIAKYLDELDKRLEVDIDVNPFTLASGDQPRPSGTAKRSKASTRPRDILQDFRKPKTARPAKLFEELKV